MVVLSIGSNCGDRRRAVASAISWLSGLLDDFIASDIYETPPVGHQGSNYMNAVVCGTFTAPLSELERSCKRYEVECGRDLVARLRNQVPVDIDIVALDNEILRPEDFKRDFFRIGYRQVVGMECVSSARPYNKDKDR